MENEVINDTAEPNDNEIETQTVGDILRHARLKQGKTLSDVATDLCIRRVYLEAIENAEYRKLPVEPYGLGYVRNYAEYLGLNGARIVQSFKETAMPKTNTKKKLAAIGEEIDGNGPSFKHVILGILLLFAAILGWNFYNQYTSTPSVEIINETPAIDYPTPVIIEEEEEEVLQPAQEDETQTTEETAVEVEAEAEAETESEKEETPAEQTDETAPHIKISVIGDSWIELKHGDEVLLSKVYQKGFEYEVPYNENLVVSVGKRNNVRFYIDGELTQVTAPRKQLNVKLDEFLKKR